MSEVWIQVIAGLSGIASTLAVKYLEHILTTRRKRNDEPSRSGSGAIAQAEEA